MRKPLRTGHMSLKTLILRAFLGSFLGVLTVIVLVIWSQKFLDNYTNNRNKPTLPYYMQGLSNPHVVSFFIKFSSYFEDCPDEIWYNDEVKAKVLSLTAMNHPDHLGSLLERTVCTQKKICYTFGYPLSILLSFSGETEKIREILTKKHKARIVSLEQKKKHLYLRFVVAKAHLVFQGGFKTKDYRGPWGFDGVFRDFETDFVSQKVLEIERDLSNLLHDQEAQLTVSHDLMHSVRLDRVWREL